MLPLRHRGPSCHFGILCKNIEKLKLSKILLHMGFKVTLNRAHLEDHFHLHTKFRFDSIKPFLSYCPEMEKVKFTIIVLLLQD